MNETELKQVLLLLAIAIERVTVNTFREQGQAGADEVFGILEQVEDLLRGEQTMSREKQIESTDWLTRGMSKEEVEREKQQAIMSADLELCHTEFESGVGEIYTDYDTTAQKMFAKGYRKQSEGEWKRGDMPTYGGYKCSVCGGNTIHYKANYCPNCGARMSGGKNE